ncbi:MAG: hypothetical protein OXG15_14900 [Gammaproteobacteria bacterium]|nr:hypothetical protein [Gammaproteobacteria bacterium]
MTTSIPTFLNDLRFGEPDIHNNLALVPILRDKHERLNYITLEEGLATKLLEVQELEDGASVNDILLRNKSDQLALLFEGEEFLGAKQNRVLNVSILAKAKSKQILPVSCVEAGRWHHEHHDPDQQRFKVANRMHYARGRASENSAVSMNLDTQRAYRGDQSSVWHDIEQKSDRLNVHSPTSASDAMYVNTKASIDSYLRTFTHTPSQVGSIFVINGEVAGLEIFASAKTHKQLLPRLIRSYALDAIDADGQRAEAEDASGKSRSEHIGRTAEAFVKRLENSWIKQFDGLCLGQNIRFKDSRITGGALVHLDRVLHLCAFATQDPDDAPIELHY